MALPGALGPADDVQTIMKGQPLIELGPERWRVHATQDLRRPSEKSCKSVMLLPVGFDGADAELL